MNIVITDPEVLGYHHHQKDLRITGRYGSMLIGILDYAEFQGYPHIQHIAVHPDHRRRGVAGAMIKRLVQDHPYETIEWGMLTPDGADLKRSLDKSYGVDVFHPSRWRKAMFVVIVGDQDGFEGDLWLCEGSKITHPLQCIR